MWAAFWHFQKKVRFLPFLNLILNSRFKNTFEGSKKKKFINLYFIAYLQNLQQAIATYLLRFNNNAASYILYHVQFLFPVFYTEIGTIPDTENHQQDQEEVALDFDTSTKLVDVAV